MNELTLTANIGFPRPEGYTDDDVKALCWGLEAAVRVALGKLVPALSPTATKDAVCVEPVAADAIQAHCLSCGLALEPTSEPRDWDTSDFCSGDCASDWEVEHGDERASHFCGDPSCCDQGDTINPIPHGLRR